MQQRRATIRVPDDYATIQEAVNAASTGDIIQVAAGTYEPFDFHGKAISVISDDGPMATIITTSDPGQDLMVFDEGETGQTLLKGFMLLAGHMGVYCVNAAPTIDHCLISDQSVTNWAAVVFAGDGYAQVGVSPAKLINCTITNSSNGGISSFSQEAPKIINSIVAFNYSYGIHRHESLPDPILAYNDVFGNPGGDYIGNPFPPGDGTISLDPMLKNDYSLSDGSPCIDAGHPSSEHNDPDGTRNDMGAIPTGAAASPYPFCFEEADVDGSGGIDVADLTYLVSYLFGGGPLPAFCE